MTRHQQNAAPLVPIRRRTIRRIVIRLSTPILTLALTAACLTVSVPPAQAQSAAAKATAAANLVPAQFTPRPDSLGVSWTLHQQTGQVNYSNNGFQHAGLLNVNGSQIHFSQPMMTKDGTEYFYSSTSSRGSVPQGLVYTRRARIDPKFPGVRWIDGVHNPGAQPVSVTMYVQSHFYNRGADSVLSDLATQRVDGLMGPKESGVFAWAQPGQGQASGLFYGCSADTKSKPTFQNQNNTGFSFTFNLTVPPGKTLSIVHAVAMYDNVPLPDAKTLTGYFAPYKSNKWLADVAGDVRKTIINRGRGIGSFAGGETSNRLADLGVEPGLSDVLAVGELTRLAGVAACESLQVTTRFGSVDLKLADVAAIAGAKDGPATVFLRDGQILVGPLLAPTLTFRPKTGGEIALPVERLDRLVLKADTRSASRDDGSVLVELTSGDRLAVRVNGDERFNMLSSWGPLGVAWSEIRSLVRDPESLGFRMQLADGTRLFVLPDDERISLPTGLVGSHDVPPADVTGVSTRLPAEELEEEPKGATVVLAGENVVAGRIDLPELTFRAEGQDLKIATTMIRTLESDDPESGPRLFTAELWDGSTLAGRIAGDRLPMRRGDWKFEAAVDELVQFRTTEPIIPESVRVETLRLIDDLGDDDFAKREAADRALAALGRLAVPQMREASDRASDPEVKRRLSALLDEANK